MACSWGFRQFGSGAGPVATVKCEIPNVAGSWHLAATLPAPPSGAPDYVPDTYPGGTYPGRGIEAYGLLVSSIDDLWIR